MTRPKQAMIVTGALMAAATGLVAVTAQSASAYDARQGADIAKHNEIATVLWVCDKERDGHAVWARYNTMADHSAPHPRLKVDYDLQQKCGYLRLSDSNPLYNYRVVEDKPGSSSNYLGPWHGHPVAWS